jgi:hypothetical protein
VSRNNTEMEMAICAAVVVGVCAGIVTIFDVPWKVSFEVFPNLLVWCVALGGMVYFGFLGSAWPVLLGWLILVFSPILNHWAGGRFGDVLYIEPAWYGKAAWQWLMAISLIGAGYGLKLWRKNRYY